VNLSNESYDGCENILLNEDQNLESLSKKLKNISNHYDCIICL
jgi:hypothetical protein